MLRTITLLVLAILLAGCNVVFIPIPIGGLTLPATLPTPEPEQPADVALFLERYEALKAAYNALVAQMEPMTLNDAAWRKETAQKARKWHDTIDILRGTTRPEGDQWIKPWNMIQQALQSYGYAADGIENALLQNNTSLFGPARSELVQGTTMMADALRLLGEE